MLDLVAIYLTARNFVEIIVSSGRTWGPQEIKVARGNGLRRVVCLQGVLVLFAKAVILSLLIVRVSSGRFAPIETILEEV